MTDKKSNPDKIKKKGIPVVFFFIGLIIMLILIRKVGIAQMVSMIRSSDTRFWISGIAVYFLSLFLRAYKWYILIKNHHEIQFQHYAPLYFLNAVIGNVTPFKSGEAVAPFLMKRHFNISRALGFSVIIIDRIMELILLLFFLSFSFIYLLLKVRLDLILIQSIWIVTIVLILFIFIFMLLIFNRNLGYGVIKWIDKKTNWQWLQNKLFVVHRGLENFYSASATLTKCGTLSWLLFVTLCCWLAQFAALWLVVYSFVPVAFMPSLVAQGIAIPVSLLSFIPAGMGITAASYQYIMSLFQYPFDSVVSAVLFSKVLFLSLIFGTGFISYLLLKKAK